MSRNAVITSHPVNYFERNPSEKEKLSEDNFKAIRLLKKLSRKPLPTLIGYSQSVVATLSQQQTVSILSAQFGEAETLKLMGKYKIGTSKHWDGATVFWQTDNQNKVRTGKIMLYNSETGKRIKEPYNHVTWVHSVLHKGDYNLKQCFFGEHLLSEDKSRPVALVESEKTALVASYYLPQFLWIASGGKNGCFNANSLSVLDERTDDFALGFAYSVCKAHQAMRVADMTAGVLLYISFPCELFLVNNL